MFLLLLLQLFRMNALTDLNQFPINMNIKQTKRTRHITSFRDDTLSISQNRFLSLNYSFHYSIQYATNENKEKKQNTNTHTQRLKQTDTHTNQQTNKFDIEVQKVTSYVLSIGITNKKYESEYINRECAYAWCPVLCVSVYDYAYHATLLTVNCNHKMFYLTLDFGI